MKKDKFLWKNESTLDIVGDTAENLINETFKDQFTRCQENTIVEIRGNDFVFDYIDKRYFGCDKISLNRVGSYLNPSKLCKNNKKKFNPIKEDDKCV